MPEAEIKTEIAWIPVTVAPHVKRLANAIAGHIEQVVKEAVDRAIAALAAPVHGPSDVLGVGTRVQDLTPAPFDGPPIHDVRGGAEAARVAVPEPAVAAEQGSTSPPMVTARAGSAFGPAIILGQALGPEIARMLDPSPPEPERERVPGMVTCSQCGKAGHNARSCGRTPKGRARAKAAPDAAPMTAIAPARRFKPTAAAIEIAKRRIAARAQAAEPRAAEPEPEHDQELEDEPDSERWSAQRIAEERELAEANKREGELPVPRSSWVF